MKLIALLTSVAYWYAANEQPAKAIEYAQKAVDAEPRYIWGHIVLARGLMKQNKPVDAVITARAQRMPQGASQMNGSGSTLPSPAA